MAKAYSTVLLNNIHILAHGNTPKNKAKENYHIQINHYSRAISKTTRGMDTAKWSTLQKISMRDTGKTIKKMVKGQ